jgi:hypothetical protein
MNHGDAARFRYKPTKLGDNASYRQWSSGNVGFLPILLATLREAGGDWARTRSVRTNKEHALFSQVPTVQHFAQRWTTRRGEGATSAGDERQKIKAA